jgi:hypothetical protein
MTRHVYPTKRVPHLWAHQTQDHARSHGNLSFQGPMLYSYNTPIGHIVTNAQGERAYLVANRSYSATTSKHVHAARMAVPVSATVFYVSSVAPGGWNNMGETTHAARVQAYQTLIDEAEGKLRRARLPYMRNHWATRADDLRVEAGLYCRFFGLAPFTPALAESLSAIEAEEARKARAREQRRLARARREGAKRRAEQAAALRVDHADDVARWQAGDRTARLPYGYPDTLLRLSPDGTEVETSRGAAVPVEHAKRLFAAYMAGTVRPGMRVGHYTVSAATPDGLTIGCHVLARPEIERFGASLIFPYVEEGETA